MAKNRDDFFETTKRNAALRVGYRCSFKDCNCPTVGASLENKNKASSIGVAAHICAAAPGGPRYDANMSADERKDISNCIWMCQNHAHLIDTDETKYTVALLRQWKQDAEKSASAALADPNFFNNCYKTNPDNFDSIYQVFKDMITEGQYSQLHLLLDQYQTGQLSDKYDEFVLRFKIIYNAYCNRSELNNNITQYASLPCKDGIDELMELFIVLQMKQELQKLISFCENPDLTRFATIIIEGREETDLLYSHENLPEPQIPEKYNNLIFKAATNDIALNIKTHIQVEDQRHGDKGVLYNEEFYFHVITSMYSIVKRTLNNMAINISDDRDLLFILEHIESIKCLDFQIQEKIWANLLRFLSDYIELFQKYYPLCPDKIKECDSIKKAYIFYLTQQDSQGISLDETVSLAERTNDYGFLSIVFGSRNKDEIKKYLDDRRYMLSKSCIILFYRIVVINQLSTEEKKSLLDDYSDTYKDDFLYHCLRAKYCDDDKETELRWLDEKLSELNINNAGFYSSVLEQHQQWEQLMKISNLTLPIYILCEVANSLAISQIKKYMVRSKEIYESALKNGYSHKGIKQNLGIINHNLGYIAAAKNCLKEEYDEYHSISALRQFISMRFNSDDFVEDSYLTALSKDIDYSSQNLVAATYSKLQKYQDAYKYFIRSLLLNDKQIGSYKGLCFISQFFSISNACTAIKENTVCTLTNDTSSVRIAIHSADILEKIVPNQFANCEHFSIEDTNISDLLYRSCGETVFFKGVEYEVSIISYASDDFFGYAFSQIIEQEDVTKICGTVEDTIEQISQILKKSKENTDKVIAGYNQSEFRIPISVLSGRVGKNMLTTCEFLAFENTERIRNNLNHPESFPQKPRFILSYDSIVFLSHLDIDLSFLDGLDLVCSGTVIKHLKSDINEEQSNISSEKSFGSMFYIDGKPQILEYTPDRRRNRHTYLNKLKSLIKQIIVIDDSFDFIPQSETWKEPFTKIILDNRLLCESSCLGLTQNLSNSILVTDDQIIYNIASVENIPNIGLVSLLTYASLQWSVLLEISKSLHKINFLNYLPIFLYKKLVDCVIDDTEHTSEGSKNVIAWLTSDTDNLPSTIHDSIVIALFREVLLHNELQYLNPDGVLGNLAIKAFDRQNPGFIAKQLEEFWEGLKNSPIELLNETDDNE